MEKNMIIGACGFGSTGSSVISDYLLEYKSADIQVLDGIEFGWVHGPDGLIDLAYHVMCPHARTSDSILAIERYVAKLKHVKRYYSKLGNADYNKFKKSVDRFIEEITTVSWNWYSKRDNISGIKRVFERSILAARIIPFIEKKVGHQINCYPMQRVYFSVAPNDFQEIATKHVEELLLALGADLNKTIVLDQPFAGNNPQACFPYFRNPYAIVVDRDPRDNYIFAKTKLLGRNHFMAVDTVDDFIKYYKALRENQPYREKNDRVLSIQFEEMVYNYDVAMGKVRNFLNLPENPNPKSIFDPALSIANTQTFKRFPQYADDIKVIEDELTEFLFDFSKYPEPDLTGKMFYGKSPKNK